MAIGQQGEGVETTMSPVTNNNGTAEATITQTTNENGTASTTKIEGTLRIVEAGGSKVETTTSAVTNPDGTIQNFSRTRTSSEEQNADGSTTTKTSESVLIDGKLTTQNQITETTKTEDDGTQNLTRVISDLQHGGQSTITEVTTPDGAESRSIRLDKAGANETTKSFDLIDPAVALPDFPGIQNNGLLRAQIGEGVAIQATRTRDLITTIKDEQGNSQTGLTDIAESFLGGQDTSKLTVASIELTLDQGVQSTPIMISGALSTKGGTEAIVIDARSLPPGTEIQLDGIDFALILGPTTARGGAGPQIVQGDDGPQTIILGPGDDILHGGGGDDVIGSEGGNDQLFGEGGRDTVFGGEGDDRLDGGAGRDLLQAGVGSDLVIGGAGWDMVSLPGARGAYSLSIAENQLRLSDDIQGTLTLIESAEYIAFESGQPLILLADKAQGSVARLYETMLGRPADSEGLAYWLNDSARGIDIKTIALGFAASPEFAGLYGNLKDDTAFLEGLYQEAFGRSSDAEGLAYWLD